MSERRVLVTGGGGFLGRAIVERCLARGWNVRVTGRTVHADLTTRGVEFFAGEISDYQHIRQAARGCEAIFHVAAKAGVWGPRAEYERINVGGTQSVIDACKAEGVPYLVHTSTPSVVFNGEPFRGADEMLPYGRNWLCHYARTKAEAERRVRTAIVYGLRTCSLRPHLIWGPHDPHIFPRILARARSGRLSIIGEGNNQVDVTHVDTAADAHLSALEALMAGRANGQAYFLSQGEPVRLWEFVNRLLKGAGIKPVTRRIPLPVAYAMGATLETAWATLRLDGEPPMTRFVATELAKDHWFNVTAARRDLQLRPAHDTWEALDRLAAQLRSE